MSVIGTYGARPTSLQITAIAYGHGAYKQIVDIQVAIDDRKIDEQVPGAPPVEEVFMLAPTVAGDWQRFDLSYTRREHGIDIYTMWRQEQRIDLNRAQREGVAFGMETRKGTLWLQLYGNNFKPKVVFYC